MGKDLKDLTLATLQKDKVETVALDIYINASQNVTLSISGPGELHLSGFFEPQRDEMDENMFLDEEEEDEEEDEDMVVAGTGKINQNLKQAKANALKNAKGGAPLAEDSDEDEDEEDESEDEDEDEEESDEDVAP